MRYDYAAQTAERSKLADEEEPGQSVTWKPYSQYGKQTANQP